ncbi:MAG: FlgD immunoglobulin-like domain containing protein [candidate division WOR-3 bacterium]
MNKHLLPVLLLLIPLAFAFAGWEPLPPVPEPVGAGGGITYGGGYVWCIVGDDNNGFYAYDVTTGEWISLDDVPEDIYYAGAIAYEVGLGRRIFVVASVEDEPDQLFIYTKYHFTGYEGEWNEEPIYLPNFEECGPGVALACRPCIKNGYLIGTWLYLLLGNGTQQFYCRFFPIPDTGVGPRGGSLESWQSLQPIPLPVKAGGAVCWNKDYTYRQLGDSLFALVGGGRTNFYCYLIGRNTWEEREPSRLPQNDGSSIAGGCDDGKELCAIFGKSQNRERHWKYNIPGYEPVWDDVHTLPTILGSGASITYDGNRDDAYLVIGGGRDGFYINRNPTEEGPQSSNVFPIVPRSRILDFSDKIVIHYSTSVPTNVRILVYNLLGKRVKTLISTNVEKGEHQVTWDKTDNSNRKVAKGIYFITITKEGETERLKVTIR